MEKGDYDKINTVKRSEDYRTAWVIVYFIVNTSSNYVNMGE